MNIRSAVQDDAAAISELITTLARKFITRDFPPDGEANFLASCDVISIHKCLSDAFTYFVASEEHSDELVGVVGFRGTSHLFHLFVAERLHGTGLGRSLWQHARSEVIPADYRGALTVNSSRNAVAFYEKLGFVSQGREDVRGGVVAVPMSLPAPAFHRTGNI